MPASRPFCAPGCRRAGRCSGCPSQVPTGRRTRVQEPVTQGASSAIPGRCPARTPTPHPPPRHLLLQTSPALRPALPPPPPPPAQAAGSPVTPSSLLPGPAPHSLQRPRPLPPLWKASGGPSPCPAREPAHYRGQRHLAYPQAAVTRRNQTHEPTTAAGVVRLLLPRAPPCRPPARPPALLPPPRSLPVPAVWRRALLGLTTRGSHPTHCKRNLRLCSPTELPALTGREHPVSGSRKPAPHPSRRAGRGASANHRRQQEKG